MILSISDAHITTPWLDVPLKEFVMVIRRDDSTLEFSLNSEDGATEMLADRDVFTLSFSISGMGSLNEFSEDYVVVERSGLVDGRRSYKAQHLLIDRLRNTFFDGTEVRSPTYDHNILSALQEVFYGFTDQLGNVDSFEGLMVVPYDYLVGGETRYSAFQNLNTQIRALQVLEDGVSGLKEKFYGMALQLRGGVADVLNCNGKEKELVVLDEVQSNDSDVYNIPLGITRQTVYYRDGKMVEYIDYNKEVEFGGAIPGKPIIQVEMEYERAFSLAKFEVEVSSLKTVKKTVDSPLFIKAIPGITIVEIDGEEYLTTEVMVVHGPGAVVRGTLEVNNIDLVDVLRNVLLGK